MRRRSSKQEAGAGFSLFSYLDGLLCTMGALIIVLICISRGARFSHKNASGDQPNGPTADELNEELKNSEWRTKHMLTSREKTLKDLQGVRQDLGHMDEHMNRLRKELQELAAAEEALAKGGGANSTDERLREDVVRLRRAVAQAQAEVAEARKKADSRRPSYAIVPYQGPNQTRRRPIYVECTGQGVILQPEGIELHPEDFAGPMGAGNPLAAALRAEREYLYDRQDADQPQEEPYPLLLVRPDGIEAYCAAREAMSSWQSDFGYELIDQDWKLEYQPPNAELAQITQTAINEARVRQRFLARSMPRAANKEQWYRAGAHGVVADGSVGRGPGGGGRRGGGGGGNGALANNFAQRANRGQRQGNGLGDGSGNGAGVGNGSRGNNSGDNPGSAGYGSGNSGLPGGSGQGDYPDGPNPYEGFADGTGGQPGAIPGTPGAGGAGAQPGNPNAKPGAGGGPGVTGPGGTELAKNGATGPAGAKRGGNPNSLNGGTGDGTGNESGNSENGALEGQPGATGAMANARGGAGGAPGAPSSNPSGGASGGGGAEAGGQASGQPGGAQSPANGGAATAGGSGNSNATGGPSGGTTQSIQIGAQQQQPGGPQQSGVTNRPNSKNASSSGSGQAGSAQDSLAKSNGKDWALPEDARNAVPIARPLVVECRPDKLIVHADGATSKVVKEIPLPGATADSINELVGTVSEQAATWGPAGRGMFWKPSLSMRVAPGGEARYADLQTLMADSGLDVRPVQAPPKQVVKPKRWFGLIK